MNWRRGLFRTWIVLSVLWVAGLGLAVLPSDYSQWVENPWRKMAIDDEQQCKASKPTQRWCLDNIVITKNGCKQYDPGPWCDYWPEDGKPLEQLVAESRRAALDRFEIHIAFLIGFPVVILGVAIAFLWVRRGFKS